MSLTRTLMDATDAMAAADGAILEALASGALVDAPTEISVALLHFGISARNLCDAILTHYLTDEMEAPNGITAVNLW